VELGGGEGRSRFGFFVEGFFVGVDRQLDTGDSQDEVVWVVIICRNRVVIK
jgi:hypothetical protein